MVHSLKGAGARCAHAVGRRIGCNELRVLRFERLKLLDERVELRIADFGIVERMVTVVVVLQQRAQLTGPRFGITLRHA